MTRSGSLGSAYEHSAAATSPRISSLLIAAFMLAAMGCGGLANAATISGTVTASATNDAIENATVCVFRPPDETVGDCGTTDGSGVYQATNLPAEPGLIARVDATGFASEFYDNVPLFDEPQSATPIDLSAGDETGIDFALDVSGRLEGMVTDAADGTAITEGYVNLFTPDGVGFFGGGTPIEADGSYAFPDIAPGDYLVFFDAAGAAAQYIDEVHDDIACPATACDLAGLGTVVTVAAGATTTVNAGLTLGSVVSGTLTRSDGGLITEAHVQMVDETGNHLAGTGPDGSGQYVFPAMPDASVRLHFQPSGVDARYIGEVHDNIPCPHFSCDIAATGKPIDLNGTNLTINAELDPGFVISGHVTDADTGADVTEGQVAVIDHLDPHTPTVAHGGLDGSGNYTTTGIPPGDYKLRFDTFGGAGAYVDELYDDIPCEDNCDIVNDGNVVSVTDSDLTINEDLVLGTMLTGTVTDADTGQPLSQDVRVEVIDSSQNLVGAAHIAPDGRYEVAIPNGTYFVFFATHGEARDYLGEVHDDVPCPGLACDYTTLGTPVDLTGGTVTIDAQLAIRGTLSGTLTDAATGDPIVEGHVELLRTDGSHVRGAHIEPNGHYDFGGVADGDYLLLFNPSGAAAGYIDELFDDVPCPGTSCDRALGTPITIAGAPLVVDEDLVRGNIISGTVVSAADGSSIPAFDVGVFDSAGAFILARGFNDGAFELEALPDGDYFLFFTTEGPSGFVDEFYNDVPCPEFACDLLADADPLTVSADTGLAIDLSPGTPVDGQLRALSDNAPLAGEIQFINALDNARIHFHTPDGAFGLTVPDGDYRVLAIPQDNSRFMPILWQDLDCVADLCNPIDDGTPLILDGTPVTLQFRAREGASISGRVLDAVTDAPLANIEVCATQAVTFIGHICGRTDGDGNYETAALPDGDYVVRTINGQPSGFVNEMWQEEPCTGFFCDLESAKPITIAGTPVDGIDLTLAAGRVIEGQVIDSTTGNPLDNVVVDLFAVLPDQIPGAGQIVTDASGTFRFDGLADGDFAFVFRREGFITQFFDGDIPEDAIPFYCPNFACFGFPGPTVSVAGADVSGLVVDMDPGARVTGTIFGPDNQPVTSGFGGVRVRVFNAEGRVMPFPFIAPQVDGSDTYTAELPPGQWFFLFETSAPGLGLVDTAFGGQPCPRGSCGMTTTTPIEVSAGDELFGIDGHLTPGATLHTRLLDGDAPGTAALVSTTLNFYNADGRYAGFAVSDDNGNASSGTGLPPGTYYASSIFTFGGPPSSTLPGGEGLIDELFDDLDCTGGCDFTTGTPIEVVDTTDVTFGDMVFVRGGSIEGTVTDESATPVPGAQVRLFDATGAPAGSAVTDNAGGYRFDGLPAGDYFLLTENQSGLHDELFDNIGCEPFCDPLAGSPVALPPGGAVTGRDFMLSAAASLAGTVTDANGGLAGVDVEVYNSLGVIVDTAVTDAAGAWQVGNLAAGDYFVRTRNTLGLGDELFDDIVCSGCDVTGGTALGLAPGEQRTGVDFGLLPAGGIAGTVEGDGQSLVGVEVQVFNAAGTRVGSDTTGSDGGWQVLGLADGDYFVATESAIGFVDEIHNNVVCEPGCAAGDGQPIPVSGGLESVHFVLDRAATISGTVRDSSGNPASGIAVRVFNAAGDLLREAVTGADGQYQVIGLPAGDAFLRTVSGGQFIDQVYVNRDCQPVCDVVNGDAVALVSGQDQTGVDFALTPGGGISGRVTNSAGSGQASLRVELFNASAAEIGSVMTSADGSYQIQGLADGRYFARTDNQRGLIDEVFDDIGCTPSPCGIALGHTIEVDGGALAELVDFELAEGSTLAGVATGPFGNPLPDGSVVLFDDQGREVERTPIDNGAWSFDGIADGSYFLVVLNGSGLVDELFDNIPCPGASCDVTQGTSAQVAGDGSAPIVTAGQAAVPAMAPGATRAGTFGISFALESGSRIRGRLVGPSSQGLADAVVFFFDSQGDPAGQATTDATGAFESDAAFPAGSYFVATANGDERGVGGGLVNALFAGSPCPLECDVTFGQAIQVDGTADEQLPDLTLSAGGAVAGTVNDDLGNPLTGAEVRLFDAGGNLAGTAAVDSTGAWTVDGLPTGSYTVLLETTLLTEFDNFVFGAGACTENCDPDPGQTTAVTAPGQVSGVDFRLFPAAVVFRDSFEP